jgi:hypothetical protein
MAGVRTNFAAFIKDFRQADALRVKAGQDAVKVEGYRQMRVLQAEIKAGEPGKKKLKGLREISKRYSGDARLKPTHARPLANLYHAIRYKVTKEGRLVFEFGAVPGKTSNTWVGIMKRRQEEQNYPVTDEMRTYLAKIGAILRGKKKLAEWPAKAFFLKTTAFKNPARDIIDTFWAAHKSEVMPNIESNFERKLRGERI